jgi:Undecaprenyl-phosphate glucose phosphotransferase
LLRDAQGGAADKLLRTGAIMINRTSQLLGAWFLGWDLALTGAAWLTAYLIRFESGWLPLYRETPDFELCLHYLPLVLLLAAVSYRIAGQYHIHRLRRFREEMVSVARGVALMTLFVIGSIFSIHSPYESRITVLVFSGLTIVIVLTARRLSWIGIRWLRTRGFNQSLAILVGTGRVARKTARAFRRASWMGIKVLGHVEDQPTRWTGDLHILGTSADLPRLIEKYRINHVFICLPLGRFNEARRVFDVLSQTVVEVRLVADLPELAGLSLTTMNLDGLPVVGLRESPHFGLNVVIKRVMDIALSLTGLVLLTPLLLGIAALVKLTSRGPVFYRQERCGLNGRTFQMLKFRSMRVDAEHHTGAVWAQKHDARRTRLGTFLRTSSLDELPQLINVLKGDMSLVGPRPERPVFINQFRRTIPNYMVRHCVKSGITGWAQVNGWRGNTSLRKRVQFDLYYITHWTPWLDLRILVLTVFKGLIHRNAY